MEDLGIIEKALELSFSDDDIIKAMEDIPQYIDITPQDFRELYKLSFKHLSKRLMSSIHASQIMTRDVITIRRGKTLTDVAKKLAKKGITGLPVVDDDDKVIGVISEKDILGSMGYESFMEMVSSYLEKGEIFLSTIANIKVEDVMRAPPITLLEDTTLGKIIELFVKERINRAPVVGRDNKIIGIVTRSDLIKTWEIVNKW